ncbi:WD40 repeat-like protein [Pluteus cervinus]|uniref:WD40 repeat-like protein n=1 Tax=Pluteus cervinus TaxID=181527 RepID=A0ACD3B758_9AGAR|nr:WD40 repeat-like protein [Pluteus cervinus]
MESPSTGTSTPIFRPSPPLLHNSNSRKETILSLVEMLLQQGDDTSKGPLPLPSFEDDRDVPTVDEHIQVVGAEAFHKFQRRINNLDKELRNFANAARQLGSSVAILSSAFHLRERLAQILFLYHENAADLFPRKIIHLSRDTIDSKRIRRSKQRAIKTKTPPHVARPIVTENLDPEKFPEQLDALAKDVITFLNCLNEFPEFTDEAVNASILAFEGDLRYWASCLQEYSGQFRYPAVQRYIHDLTTEMGEHIDSITTTLSMFIEVGVPTIRFAQKHGATNLLNLSTVATFFSAVTATTLQFSFDLERSPASDAVNCFWFGSLVFSIAAAVNSLLGLTWKQAMYRSPGHRVPWWVLIWIKRSPLVFLVMSVACFSIGLCCFTYATSQAPITSMITTIFTTFTSFGLAAVSAWFATERYIFLRHHGEKWLSDVLVEMWNEFRRLPGMAAIGNSIRHLSRQIRAARNSVQYLRSRTSSISSHTSSASSMYYESDGNTLPAPSPASPSVIPTPLSPTTSDHPFGLNTPPTLLSPTLSPSRELWGRALRGIQRQTGPSIGNAFFSRPTISSPREPERQPTSSSEAPPGGYGEKRRAGGEEPVKAVLRSRAAALVPKLKILEPAKDLAAHSALVRHLQFSPDGKFLATSSWDKTSIIFRVGEPFVSQQLLSHAQGFVGQVAWSPTGKYLLTKSSRGVKLWTPEDGVCVASFDRKVSVESIAWFPEGDGEPSFISVEGSDVTKLVRIPRVLDRYHFKRMKLHDVAITPDSTRLLGVGPLLESRSGLQPSKCKVEKRLVVYNMESKTIENQTPVLNDVRDITVAQGATHTLALVSYENQAPPQLWRIEFVKDRENNNTPVARLTLRHTYMPKVAVDFAGPSYFGGKNNELVLCAGKAGDVHVWDQESGALLHHVRSQALGGDLTCIAWNHAAEDPFMFATGSHDGAVRIWTKAPEDRATSPTSEDELPPRSQSPAPYVDHEPRTESPQPMNRYEYDPLQAFSARARDVLTTMRTPTPTQSRGRHNVAFATQSPSSSSSSLADDMV